MNEIEQLITDCETRESRLNDWERAFIDSAKTRVEGGKGLNQKQRDTLSAIWEKVTEKG